MSKNLIRELMAGPAEIRTGVLQPVAGGRNFAMPRGLSWPPVIAFVWGIVCVTIAAVV